MNASKNLVHFARTQGRLPAWLWRSMYSARNSAGTAVPVVVVDDDAQTLVVIALDDYNAIIDGLREEKQS